MLKPKMGPPIKYLPEDKIDLIVEGFGKVFSIRRAAGWAKESPYHLKKWLDQGEDDLKNGIESPNAHLFVKVAYRLTQKASEYVATLESCPNNAGSITWLMEKCLREDYGNDAQEYKELESLYTKLMEKFTLLENSPTMTRQLEGESE